MRILFIGDYSNLHACLATELRRRGHNITIVANGGGYMNTDVDIRLCRKPGLAGSISYLAKSACTMSKLRGFDVVQLINTQFLSLKSAKLSWLYHILRRHNGAMCLTLASNDFFYVKSCTDGHTFPFSEWRVGSSPTPLASSSNLEAQWITADMEKHARLLYDTIDGAVSVLPEYHIAAEPLLGNRLAYAGIPIDLQLHPFSKPNCSGKIKIFVGMKPEMVAAKGTDILLKAAQKAQTARPDIIEVECVGGVSYKEYLQRLSSAHIVVDQLYAISPATNALDAMAMGKVAASGANPIYYNFIGQHHYAENPADGPILPLEPTQSVDEIANIFINAASNPDVLQAKAILGRKLVEENNDVKIVADRFLNHWNNLLSCR